MNDAAKQVAYVLNRLLLRSPKARGFRVNVDRDRLIFDPVLGGSPLIVKIEDSQSMIYALVVSPQEVNFNKRLKLKAFSKEQRPKDYVDKLIKEFAALLENYQKWASKQKNSDVTDALVGGYILSRLFKK